MYKRLFVVLALMFGFMPKLAHSTNVPWFIDEAADRHRMVWENGGDCKTATLFAIRWAALNELEWRMPLLYTNKFLAPNRQIYHTLPAIKYKDVWYFIDVNKVGKKYRTEIVASSEYQTDVCFYNTLHKKSSIKFTSANTVIADNTIIRIAPLLDKLLDKIRSKITVQYFRDLHESVGDELGPQSCKEMAFSVYREARMFGFDTCILDFVTTQILPPHLIGKYNEHFWGHVFAAVKINNRWYYIDSLYKQQQKDKDYYIADSYSSKDLKTDLKYHNRMRKNAYRKFDDICDEQEIALYRSCYRRHFFN